MRTIFISGLPEDVKERELLNLLRWLPGYEASQVNFKGEHPMGFALFSTPQLAVAAKDALQVKLQFPISLLLALLPGVVFSFITDIDICWLQDMVFDTESNSVLHIEMAKKNLFVKRGEFNSIVIELKLYLPLSRLFIYFLILWLV